MSRPLRTAFVTASALLLAAVFPASAQSIRGRVIDDSTKAPIAGVALTLLDTRGREIGTGTRSISDGSFRLNAPDKGTFRVGARRIGYSLRTTDAIQLMSGEVVTLELPMSRVAQVVAPVRIVERARMSLRDLMTSDGYELRRAHGIGRFVGIDSLDRQIAVYGPTMTVEQLAELGVAGMARGFQLRPNCAPHIYVDGLRLTGGARSAIGPYLSVADMPAAEVYAIEVYRKSQIPPGSLGGPFGTEPVIDNSGRVVPGGHTMAPKTCGIVAVWTKGGVRRPTGAPGPDEPALRGTVLTDKVGSPVAGASVVLRTEHGTDLGAPVTTDGLGKFAIRVPFRSRFRLVATHPSHDKVTTTPFAADTGQTLIVELTIAVEGQVELPLTVRQTFYGPLTGDDSTGVRRTNPPSGKPLHE